MALVILGAAGEGLATLKTLVESGTTVGGDL